MRWFLTLKLHNCVLNSAEKFRFNLKIIFSDNFVVSAETWWLLNVNLWLMNQSFILRSSQGLYCEQTNPDPHIRKLRQELLSGFSCDINRKLLQLVKTSGSCCTFATESVQLCTFMTTSLQVLNIVKHIKPNCTKGFFSLVFTGFGRVYFNASLLSDWPVQAIPLVSFPDWGMQKATWYRHDFVLFVRYHPTICTVHGQFTPGTLPSPHVSGLPTLSPLIKRDV